MSFGPDGTLVGAVLMPPKPVYRPRWWLHGALFVATFASTTFVGGFWWGSVPIAVIDQPTMALIFDPRLWLAGLWFSVPLMFILLCHEMGHYLACRSHGLMATPPFFLPLPTYYLPLGTLGAVIRIKEPIRNKRQLLDVGASGPIAGFIAILPVLCFGLLASETTTAELTGGYILFGEPLIYRLAETLLVTGGDGTTLNLHPTGIAAMFGLLITLLNLLPFAQLDGGHVTYALLGRWHQRLAWPLLIGLVAMGFFWHGWWLWAVIAIVMGPRHPRIWDEDLPLDRKRQLVAVLTIVIFILCFMIAPVDVVFDPPLSEPTGIQP